MTLILHAHNRIAVESALPVTLDQAELLTEWWLGPGRAVGVYGHPDPEGTVQVENGTDCVRATYPVYCIAHTEFRPDLLTSWEVQQILMRRPTGGTMLALSFAEAG